MIPVDSTLVPCSAPHLREAPFAPYELATQVPRPLLWIYILKHAGWLHTAASEIQVPVHQALARRILNAAQLWSQTTRLGNPKSPATGKIPVVAAETTEVMETSIVNTMTNRATIRVIAFSL